MTKARLCFIGAGFHASTNIFPSVIEAGAHIQAIATRHIERSQDALRRFGSTGNAYDNVELMLEQEKCDGVVIVAQPTDQTDLVQQCIAAGKHIYVDKPLGWTAVEALQIANAAEQAGVQVMVGFMKRYAPIYTQLKELITAQTLGKVRSFQLSFAVDSTPFCQNEEQYIKLAAIHMIDLIRFLFGEVHQLSGFRNNHHEHISQSISLQLANGVVGNVSFSGMTAWSRESEKITVTFEHGFACADEVTTLQIHQAIKQEGLPWQSLAEYDQVYTPSASAMSGGYRDLYLRGFVGEMVHFIQCCQTNQLPDSSATDNVKTMELCDRILASLL